MLISTKTPIAFDPGERLRLCLERKTLMTKYLKDRVETEDWRGVQDAASGLRELQQEIDIMNELLE